MLEHYENTPEFDLIEAIARALRQELGPAMEEQPGGVPGEFTAGQVNRAFRVVVRSILRAICATEEDLPALVSGVLARLARRRLEGGGLAEDEVEFLLGLGHGRDDWLAFLVLTPWEEAARLLREEKSEGGPDAT